MAGADRSMGEQVTARKRTAVLVVLTSVAALVATAPVPAAADTHTFRDRRADTSHPADILSVKVEHGVRVVVVVRHRNLTFTDGPGAIRVAYDTGSRHSGPDFFLRIRYQTDQLPELRTASGWGNLTGAPVPTCSGEQVSVSALRNTTRISIPRSCYGNPRSIRVHVRLELLPTDQRKVDVAPRSRTMGPAVRL